MSKYVYLAKRLKAEFSASQLKPNEFLLVHPQHQNNPLVKARINNDLLVIPTDELHFLVENDVKERVHKKVSHSEIYGWGIYGNLANKIFGINHEGNFVTFFELRDASYPAANSSIGLYDILDGEKPQISISYDYYVIGQLAHQKMIDSIPINTLQMRIYDKENRSLYYDLECLANDPKVILEDLVISNDFRLKFTSSIEGFYYLFQSDIKNENYGSLFEKVHRAISAFSVLAVGNAYSFSNTMKATNSFGEELVFFVRRSEPQASNKGTRTNYPQPETINKISNFMEKYPNTLYGVSRITNVTGQAEMDLVSSFAVFEAAYKTGEYAYDENAVTLYKTDRQFYSKAEAQVFSVWESILKQDNFSPYLRKVIKILPRLLDELEVRKIIKLAYLLRNQVSHHNLVAFQPGIRSFIYLTELFTRIYMVWLASTTNISSKDMNFLFDDLYKESLFVSNINELLDYVSFLDIKILSQEV